MLGETADAIENADTADINKLIEANAPLELPIRTKEQDKLHGGKRQMASSMVGQPLRGSVRRPQLPKLCPDVVAFVETSAN